MEELIDVMALLPQHQEITGEDLALDARMREREERLRERQRVESLIGSLELTGAGAELAQTVPSMQEGEA